MKDLIMLKRLPLIGLVLVFLVTTIYVLSGPPITLRQDTSAYSKRADLMIMSGFSLKQYSDRFKNASVKVKFMSVGFVYIVAIFKKLLGEYWYIGIIFINLISICLTTFFVLTLIKWSTRSTAALIAVICMSVISIDFLIRSRLILTDTSYMFFAFCVYVLLSFAVTIEHSMKKIVCIVSAVFLTFLLFFYRPVNIVAFAFLIITLCEFGMSIIFRGRDLVWLLRRSAVLLGLSSIIVILIFTTVMKYPSIWPFKSFYSNIRLISEMYKAGLTVHGRPVFIKKPDTYRNNVVNYKDYIILVFKKIGIFFQISVSTFSKSHKILKYLFYVPVYFFSIISLFFIFKNKIDYERKAKWVGWLAFQWVFLFTIYHSLTWIDYTWRYRLPCVPALLILAGLGFYQSWKKFIKPKLPNMKLMTS